MWILQLLSRQTNLILANTLSSRNRTRRNRMNTPTTRTCPANRTISRRYRRKTSMSIISRISTRLTALNRVLIRNYCSSMVKIKIMLIFCPILIKITLYSLITIVSNRMILIIQPLFCKTHNLLNKSELPLITLIIKLRILISI